MARKKRPPPPPADGFRIKENLRPTATDRLMARLEGKEEAAKKTQSKAQDKGIKRGTISDWVEANLYIDRKPMSLALRPYLRWIYDISPDCDVGSRNITICAGRQVEKSSSISAKSIALGAIYDMFYTLIVQPRFDQVRVFSQQRFHPMCQDSPNVIMRLVDHSCVWQVGARQFVNGSFYNFRSCFYSADPLRGLTSHHIAIDELQDIISDNIPIILEQQSHIPPLMRFNTYSGTPKTSSNTLSTWYNETCQFEWIVKCEACNHGNFLDEKVIGRTGYICSKCGKPINVRAGQWQPQRPSKLNEAWGFRISQIMAPFMSHADVLRKMEDPNIPRRVFFNECLGLPYDVGQLVLTQAEIMQACENRPMITPETVGEVLALFIVGGLDHGTGEFYSTSSTRQGRSAKSFTAMAFGAFFPDKTFKILKILRFLGEDASLAAQPGIIDRLARTHGARWVMSDYGFGAQTNSALLSSFGWVRTERANNPVLLECQYVGGVKPVTWNPKAFRYMVNRNWAIEKTVDAIKAGIIKFPKPSEMEPYISDFTSIYTEYDHGMNRLRYDHTLPDDCFQAVAYCYMAALQATGRLTPTIVPNVAWTD